LGINTHCACVFKFSCSKPPLAMLLVDDTGNSLTMTSIQLKPEKREAA
jgi:hypothetical protein